MASTTIRIAEETSPRRVFVWALTWPGWCRSGRNPEAAVEALVAAGTRYDAVAKVAGLEFPVVAAAEFRVVTRVEGGSGTDFGVPSTITADDRLAVNPAEAKRLAALVSASWLVFDQAAATAPEELRKGPRGGGRDTSKIVAHVNEADSAYAREIGIKKPLDPNRAEDGAGVAAMRAAVLEILGKPSDGSPLGGRKWPQLYAVRRIAWHALDHAWEIEDRSR